MHHFGKAQRLLTKQAYSYVFEEAKKVSSREFTLLFRANNLGHARLGLIIAKKAINKSHDRNRVKRLVRESFRRQSLPAVDIIVMGKAGIQQLENAHVLTILSNLWNKLSTLYVP